VNISLFFGAEIFLQSSAPQKNPTTFNTTTWPGIKYGLENAQFATVLFKSTVNNGF
jgi:hypothetical protein